MNVKVWLFATMRQLAGWKERTFTLADGARLADLIALMDGEQPEMGLMTRTYYASINEDYAKGDWPLQDGDTVGIFPPVSGG